MRTTIQLAAGVCLALGLAGCGGSSSEGTAPSAAAVSPVDEASPTEGTAPQQVCDFAGLFGQMCR